MDLLKKNLAIATVDYEFFSPILCVSTVVKQKFSSDTGIVQDNVCTM